MIKVSWGDISGSMTLTLSIISNRIPAAPIAFPTCDNIGAIQSTWPTLNIRVRKTLIIVLTVSY